MHELIEGLKYSLDPEKHYILFFKRSEVSQLDMEQLSRELKHRGFDKLIIMMVEEPKNIKIVEKDAVIPA